ncbi:hypothetical protein LCI18_005138 [Fusarium solani-melongenae]|uniref:Uncharacterized protein n=1 Tax=Fusarium solani subsp. cucurbitae TaxID=2747967 RepID=A0ACD3Z266_FUSSC|nr:hypothetical protein LCI18_005138 [Fusarium solani-melongenae]
MRSLSFFAVKLLALTTTVRANPGPTATLPPANLIERDTSSTRVTTSYYALATTQVPRDEYYVGMGKNGTRGNYYWVSCISEPFTTISSYGGCGRDDVYTRCSGRTALGIDGGEVLCDVECVTHRIYQDLDVTTWTPFLGCGRGTSTMNLLRTSTHSGDQDATTTTGSLTTTTTTDEPNLGTELRPYFGMARLITLVGVIALVQL